MITLAPTATIPARNNVCHVCLMMAPQTRNIPDPVSVADFGRAFQLERLFG
jgi:hypothetical protein